MHDFEVGDPVQVIKPDDIGWFEWSEEMSNYVGQIGTVTAIGANRSVNVYFAQPGQAHRRWWFSARCVSAVIVAPDGDALQRLRCG